MKKIVLMTSLYIVSSACGAILPPEYTLDAEQKISCAQTYNNPYLSYPHQLRSIFAETKEKNIVQKNDLGVGLIRVFKTNDELYVICGNRFSRGTYKLTTGGAVELNDATGLDTIVRELKEEFFGNLPITSTTKFLKKHFIAGGIIRTNDGALATKNWGPYLTFFAIEKNYTIKDLKEAVANMNTNAILHYPMATLFDKISKNELAPFIISATAAKILNDFALVTATNLTPITPPTKEAENKLLELIDNPSAIAPEEALNFAKMHIHDYTEYSDFKLVTWKEYLSNENIKKYEAPALLKMLDNLIEESHS